MLSKNDIKYIRSLSQGKFRKRHASFIAEGSKIINEFHNEGVEFERLFCLDEVAPPMGLDPEYIKAKELSQISQLSSANDSLAVLKIPENKDIDIDGLSSQLVIVCEKLQDPGNMGTIIRIADWFGIQNIICSPDCVDVYSSKVVQSSMGSLSRVKITYREISLLISELKSKNVDYPVMTSSLKGNDIYKEKLPNRGMLILGNESKGVSEALHDLADSLLKIPSYGKAESLNVAVSAGIMLAEFKRQS